MKLSLRERVLGIATLGYIALFGIYFLLKGNTEFLWYIAVMLAFVGFIGLTIGRSRLPFGILAGLSAWGFMHMAGGGLTVGDGVLYALPLFHITEIGDTMILKYDQFVHAFGFFMATLAMHHLIRQRARTDVPEFGVTLLAAAAGMGLGALNEVAEFAAVLALHETGVGGYYNTALDLVFNMAGAVLAALVLYARKRKLYLPVSRL